MTTAYSQTAQDVRNLANKFKSLIDLADFLDKCGSLDNEDSEIQKRIGDSKLAEQKQRDLEGVATAAATTAQAKVDDLTTQASEIIGRAHNQANDLVTAARNEATTLTATATQTAADAAAHVELAKATLNDTNAMIEAARKELVDTNAKIETAKAAALAAFQGSQP